MTTHHPRPLPHDPTLVELYNLKLQLDRIEARLNSLSRPGALDVPPVDPADNLIAISDTRPGTDNHVVPGFFVLRGASAQRHYDSLPIERVMPLFNLPPWTHIAIADGTWWLLERG